MGISKYKEKRQHRLQNHADSSKNMQNSIDVSGLSEQQQQRVLNRVEFNKSHDYKKKSDKKRLDIGRVSQGNQEEHEGNPGVKAMMSQTHYQNNLIPKDMLGQTANAHQSLNTLNGSP